MEVHIDDFENRENSYDEDNCFNEVHVANIERTINGLNIEELDNVIQKNPDNLIDLSNEIERLKDAWDDLTKYHYCIQIKEKIQQCPIRNFDDYSFLIRLVCVLELQNYFMGSNVSLLRQLLEKIPAKTIPKESLGNMMNTLATEIVSVSSANGDRIHLMNVISCGQPIWKPMTVLVAWLILKDIFNIPQLVPFSFENLRLVLAGSPLPASAINIKSTVQAIVKIVFNSKLTADDGNNVNWLKLWLQSVDPKMEQNFLSKEFVISRHNQSFIKSMVGRVICNWPSYPDEMF